MSDDKTPDLIWATSGRIDDRLVIWEREPRHPGGEAFIGGASPDYVARTEVVEELLRTGELVEIPEPPDSRKKPQPKDAPAEGNRPDMPGSVTRLGRVLDPEVVPNAKTPTAKSLPVPAGVVVPPEPGPARESTRR